MQEGGLQTEVRSKPKQRSRAVCPKKRKELHSWSPRSRQIKFLQFAWDCGLWGQLWTLEVRTRRSKAISEPMLTTQSPQHVQRLSKITKGLPQQADWLELNMWEWTHWGYSKIFCLSPSSIHTYICPFLFVCFVLLLSFYIIIIIIILLLAFLF